VATILTKTAIYVKIVSAVQFCISTKDVYPRKSMGTKHRAYPPLQKVGGIPPCPPTDLCPPL